MAYRQAVVPGLLIQLSDFLVNYHMHPLYYFDLGQKHLVPDPRYSPLADQSLATWLLDQLLSRLAGIAGSGPDDPGCR